MRISFESNEPLRTPFLLSNSGRLLLNEADGNVMEKNVVKDEDKIIEYTVLFKGSGKENINKKNLPAHWLTLIFFIFTKQP